MDVRMQHFYRLHQLADSIPPLSYGRDLVQAGERSY